MAEFQKPICGCFDDCATCIVTYFIPCYTAGKNAEAMDENCLLCGFLSIVPPVGIFTRGTIRKKIREKYGIQGRCSCHLFNRRTCNHRVRCCFFLMALCQTCACLRLYIYMGSFANDLICACCCGLCALVQEAQEIKAHGGAPSGMSMARE